LARSFSRGLGVAFTRPYTHANAFARERLPRAMEDETLIRRTVLIV
jgi:hypothetical protein